MFPEEKHRTDTDEAALPPAKLRHRDHEHGIGREE